MRILHVVFGMYFLGSFLASKDPLSGLLGMVLLVQAYFNAGCILGACAPTQSIQQPAGDVAEEEVIYEEINS